MSTAEEKRRPRVVIDTNVFVSALNFGGKPDEVLALALEGEIQLIVSPFILAETAGVLLEKFGWSHQRVQEALEAIQAIATIVHPTEWISLIKALDTDNRILECAVEGKADVIVTGDTKHLQPLKTFRGIPILSPAEFLRRW